MHSAPKIPTPVSSPCFCHHHDSSGVADRVGCSWEWHWRERSSQCQAPQWPGASHETSKEGHIFLSPKISSEFLILSLNLIENEWETLSNVYIFKFSSLYFKFCVLNRNRILFCFIQFSGNFWERIKVLRKLVSETTWNNFPSLRFTQTKFKYLHFQRIVQEVFWQELTAYGGDCVEKICSQSFQEYENI